MNKIIFIYLKEDFGIYRCSDESRCEDIRRYLKDNGIKAEQFIEDNLVNIIDTVDDIMIEEYENVVFFIDDKNIRISKMISREIKLNYEDTKIIWFGKVNNYMDHLNQGDVDIIAYENIENALLKIAGNIDLSDILGIVYSQNKESYVCDDSLTDILKENMVCKEDNDSYKTAMINGINASITGLYPESVIGNCSKHVTISKQEITEADYRNLKDFLGLNSAVIHKSNSQNGYLENIDKSEEGNCYLSHYHKIDNNNIIKIDNSNIEKELRFVNYSDATSDLEDSYLKIETKDDIKALLNDVKIFKETGIIKKYIIKNKIENECRWTGSGACNLKTLARLNVDEEGNIKPCRGCEKIIGNIKDGYSTSVRNIYRQIDKSHISRECRTCEVHDSCSKCSMLMGNIDNEYCSIRKNNPEISDYFIKKNILNYLINNTNTFKNLRYESIKFSSKYRTYLFPKESVARNENLTQQHVCLVFVEGSPILIELLTGNLNKISNELAFVFEGLIKGFDVEGIKNKFKEFSDNKDCENSEIVDLCINLLTKNNYIKVVD